MTEKMIIKQSMELPHRPDDVFAFITDLDAVAPCVPGATLDPPVGGEPETSREGEVVMAFGPIRYRYRGTIEITEKDPAARTVNFGATGTETSGEGALSVQMLMTVGESGDDGSSLDVVAEAAVTGMIAEYGQGLVDDVASDIIAQFVKAVSSRDIAATTDVGSTEAAGGPAPVEPARPIGGFRLLLRSIARGLRRRFSRSKGAHSNG